MFRKAGYTALLFICTIPYILYGQDDSSSDTLKLNEIVIKESPIERVLAGFGNSLVDSMILREHSLGSISDALAENTSLFIKNYGPGGIATPSFRGTGAVHTLVLWNDIAINSPMSGQADFSIIPAGFADEVRIFNGGASLILGSGGLGGVVNISTKPSWKKGADIKINSGSGSFGTFSSLARLRAGSGKFQSVTRLFINSAENNFTYLNRVSGNEPVYEKRQDASALRKSAIQEFFFRGRKSIFSAGVWYNAAERSLPSSILVNHVPGSESQTDEAIRTYLSYSGYGSEAAFDASLSFCSEKLNYFNRQAGIESLNNISTFRINGATEFRAGNKTFIKLSANNEMNFVRSVNFSHAVTRNNSAITASLRYFPLKNTGMVVLLRENMTDFNMLIPDFSFGIDYTLPGRAGETIFRLNAARNSRIPAMNDLYWNPGGNRDLRNEYSITGEGSVSHKLRLSENLDFEPDITFYTGRIRDLIRWRPGPDYFWSPENVSESVSRGLDAGFSLKYHFNSLSAGLSARYSHNRSFSIDNSGEKYQLVYIPLNLFNSSIRLSYRNVYMGITSSFTGKRYTDLENTSSLNGYFLTGLTSGFKTKFGRNMVDLTLRADNIFGVYYEVIAYYPMPAASYFISFIYHFSR
jgi:iron complex outermembrane receptor protein